MRTYKSQFFLVVIPKNKSSSFELYNKWFKRSSTYIQYIQRAVLFEIEMAYRDMSIPYTEEEVLGLRNTFRSMPTYKNGCVSLEDVPELFKKARYERTPEQLRKIQEFWVENWNGKTTEDRFINLFCNLYNTREFARQLVLEVDVNHDGFISEDEFQSILKYLNKHDSTFSGKTYQNFVSEADTNKDGKVDIEECVVWLQKQYKK